MVPTRPDTRTTREHVQRLIAFAEQWRILDAMQEFYADDVVMQENLNPPTVGLRANLERERAFVASIATVNEMKAFAVLVDGDRAVVNWHQDLVTTDGQRLRFDQLSLQLWKDGKIVHERFVYDPASLSAA
ncbi:MAG TPA: SnoaL-like domain-containing protein [Gemmatimonadaceae bacterium]|nr:SnoaL-like domain-containing protein [Gemmatimonadaceae bacterium]